MSDAAWTRAAFEARLRERGRAYHIHHPFNLMLNGGKATREQIRGWVANNWVQRILDHDGHGDDPGGIEAWLRLAEAVGLERAAVESLAQVLPGVRFAVDAYVNFARRAPWPEAVCASLTELFAPEIHRQRLAGWPQHYPWIDAMALAYGVTE